VSILGEGLVGRNADLRGGDNIREGGKGVVDLGGLAGACETRLDEFDRAKEVAAEFDRPRGLGALPLGAGNCRVLEGTSEDPGAFGSSMCGVTWLLGALGTSGIAGG
jgi:hypothetical protein